MTEETGPAAFDDALEKFAVEHADAVRLDDDIGVARLGEDAAKPGPAAFDAAGREPVELADIAVAVVRVVGRTGVTRPAPTGPASRYLGDRAAYEAHQIALQVEAVGFPAQVREAAGYLAATARAAA